MIIKYRIVTSDGDEVALIECRGVHWVERGVDFQPNIFNGYHAVELGGYNPPAVLNLPVGMKIERCA